MDWQPPKRFTAEWWEWIGVASLIIAASSALLLQTLDLLSREYGFWVILVCVAIGDLLVAFSFEAVAPSEVTIGPGEKIWKDSELRDVGEIVAGFDNVSEGRIRVCGEEWSAELSEDHSNTLQLGDKVEIVGRNGLTLAVRALKHDT